MRSGARLGMVLDTEHRFLLVGQPFDGLIVEINVRHLHPGPVNRIGIDSKIVILRRDFNFVRAQVNDWMVAPVMAELQPKSLGPCSESKYLVTKADSHYGNPANERFCSVDSVLHRARIRRSVG